jgi:large subunit ribosomal protein L18
MKMKSKTFMARCAETGKELAKLALGKKIESVVFDRGGFKYVGRVKAFADGAREGGLKF